MDYQDDNRSIVMSEVMTPEKANFAGHIHGGHLLLLLDRVAYACASRYSRRYVVTLSVDDVIFKQVIDVGELVTCFANVNYVGNSSMEVGIKVIAENLMTGEKRHTNSCFFTMVALDENHKPVKVSPLQCRNMTEIRRYEEAKLRQEIRKQLEETHNEKRRHLHEKLQNNNS